MDTTRSQHANHAEGSRSFAPLLDHTNRLLNLDQSSKIYSRKVRQASIARMVSQVLGPWRVFHGSVTIPDARTARQSDADRLSVVQGAIEAGHAAIYWTDGSYVCDGRGKGFSGAGVVWNVNGIMGSKSYTLQRYMGKSAEAEIFAIAAALGCARSELRSGKDIRLVRIYTDSVNVLRSLMNGTGYSLGPMQGRKTSIEYVYDLADYLKNRGVTLELLWVKGHSQSEGNRLADRVAGKAAREGIALLDPENAEGIATETDVPDIWKELGEDWVQEWLFRANLPTVKHYHYPKGYQSHLAGNGGDVIKFDSVNPNRNYNLDECILDLLRSSLTLDNFILGLHIQWESIDAHLEELEIAVAENGGEGFPLRRMRRGFINEAWPLYDQRACVEKAILVHTAMRTNLAKQVEEAKMVALLGQLEDLDLSDIEDELERQIEDDIALALAQRHR